MAFLPPGMQHVERQDLYTSLRARVRFLQNFIDFSRSDLVALEEGQDVIKAAIPGIVESVYKKLLAYDVTARVFSSRDSRSEEDPDVWANNNSAAIQNRKIFLRWYLTKLNSDPTRYTEPETCLVFYHSHLAGWSTGNIWTKLGEFTSKTSSYLSC